MKKTKYKVCILAAGAGSQMDHLSDHVNRGILPVNNKAVISYMIEKFPKETEFVVAIGHKKESVTDYLKLAYPERRFTFVEIKNFAGPGTGPGASLLSCKKHLQCPFIFSTSDTIVTEDVPLPDHNWMGIAPVHETEPYCTVKIRNNSVYQIDDKVRTDNHFAFIGLAGVNDYKTFFKALESDTESVAGELQVSTGLKALIEKRLVPMGFTWFDTGALENYIETNKNFSGEGKFDFSKSNEFLYFVNGRVMKFFADRSITDKRHTRSKKALKGLTPNIEAKSGHFYSYRKVEGQTMYSVLNAKVTGEFLEWAKANLWKKLKLSKAERKRFDEAAHRFYKEKTEERVRAFQEKSEEAKKAARVNGQKLPSAEELLSKVDWSHIAAGEPTNFHGDLQFDNVLVREGYKKPKDQFVLLDWRHDFGGMVEAGDLYYDLAKLYGGMILSYPLIKEGMFHFGASGSDAHYHYFVKNDILEARERYEEFLSENGFDLKKIKILTSIIFLNMAPLHNEPFDKMLYHMGRKMLHKSLGLK
jgi:NDP-sugar pyrophosphorylase family protein